MGSYDPLIFARLGIGDFDAALCTQQAATDCRAFDDVLVRGIGAFRWLERAEETVMQAENDCLTPYSPEAHSVIEELYQLLLGRFEEAEMQARQVTSDGLAPDTLAEFRDCHSRTKNWVETQAAIHAATLSHDSLTQYARHVAG